MNMMFSGRNAAAKRSGIVSVLDVGSNKVCCIIAKLQPRGESEILPGRTHQARVIGIGHQKSLGIKSGMIVELDRAEQAIRLAVDAAERMAGLTVDSLIVNASAGRLKSRVFTATIDLGGHEADEADIRRVLSAGSDQVRRSERDVVHAMPIGFSLDAEKGVRDPRGMIGDTLGVDMHVLTADSAPLRNLELCINRSHLSVERFVATPYASGLAALVEDETELGAACIDFGGGTTTLSVFFEGKLVHVDALPIGGNHITMDLAKGLSTRLAHAERLKVMHGSALPASADDRDIVTVNPMGEDGEVPLQVPRSVMNRIIRARVEEPLEFVRDRLNRSGYGGAVGKRVVMTGGASQLTGMNEAARRIWSRNVRLGRPMGVSGLPEAAKGPAFSTAVGMLIYPQVSELEGRVSRGKALRWQLAAGSGRFQRMSQWLRESF